MLEKNLKYACGWKWQDSLKSQVLQHVEVEVDFAETNQLTAIGFM